MSTQNKKAALFEAVGHYLTAFVVLLKGVDKISTPGKVPFGIFFLAVSVIIFLGTIFHHRLAGYMKHFKAIVYLLETVVISLVGYLYIKEGKHYLQYACFLAAVAFLIAAFIHFKKSKAGEKAKAY